MAKQFSRSDRVAEQIQRELADLLQFEVKDPRVGQVTLTEVQVSGDLAHAKVFSTQGDAVAATLGLSKAAGFLRSQLAQRLLLRSIPQLHFSYDHAIERGFQLSQLIDEAVASDKHNP